MVEQKQRYNCFEIGGAYLTVLKMHNEIPGPGSYNPANNTTELGKGPRYSLSGRSPLPAQEIERTPGPGILLSMKRVTLFIVGSYAYVSHVGKNAPAYSLSGKYAPSAVM